MSAAPRIPDTVRASALTRAEQRRAPVFVFESEGRWTYARRPPEDGRQHWVYSTINRQGSYFGPRKVEAAEPVPQPASAPEMHPETEAVVRRTRGALVFALATGREVREGWPARWLASRQEVTALRRRVAELETENETLRGRDACAQVMPQ
jgi:hypothetical protein